MSRDIDELIEWGYNKSLIKKERGRIFYTNQNKKYVDSPEERIRAAIYIETIKDYQYAPNQVDVEVKIQLGSNRWDFADIIVYTDDSKAQEWIIIETKRPKRFDGLIQLRIYQNATGAPLGWWTNGRDEVFRYRRDPNIFTDLNRIPRLGERIVDVGKELRRKDLEPAVDLESDFRTWEDHILAHQGVDVFNELFKLIYAKLYDELINLTDGESLCQFRVGIDEDTALVSSRIQNLFDRAINEWQIFQPNERIELRPDILSDIVGRLQRYDLWGTDIDVLGAGFEFLVTSTMKGEKGQFFTPRTVVRIMGKMTKVERRHKVLDPACGSGGFLIWVMHHSWNLIERRGGDSRTIAREQFNYANEKIFGIDYEARMVKIARANMLMRENGKLNILLEDSLRDYSWTIETKRKILPNSFHRILTNPPFAGEIKDIEVLQQYMLAHKNGKMMKRQSRHILFIEMCLKYLAPGGVLAIVLPKGVFNNPTLKYVRDFIQERSKILACVSLDPYVFAPHTGNRAGLLFLQKKRNSKEDLEDYPIFMAISSKSGKRQGGRPLYKKSKSGALVLDNMRKPILNSDLEDIANVYLNGNIPSNLSNYVFFINKSKLRDRIDPEYYKPVSQELIYRLRSSGIKLKPLSGIADYIRNTIDPTKTPEKTFRYIELDDINSMGIIERTSIILGRDAPSRARILVHSGDIITAMSGSQTGSITRHRAAIIDDDYDGCVVSTGFGVLRPKEGIDIYYLYALIRIPYVLDEMRRRLQGGGIPKISEDDLMEILIPDFPEEERERISQRVKDVLNTLKGSTAKFKGIKKDIQTFLGMDFTE